MCKFSGESAPGWNVLAGVLSEFVARAPAIVAAKWQQLFEQEHLDVGWKIRTTLHGRKFSQSARMHTTTLTCSSDRYRTPSPGRIDMGGGGPIEGVQRQGMLTGVDGIILPDAASEYGSDPGADGETVGWGNDWA